MITDRVLRFLPPRIASRILPTRDCWHWLHGLSDNGYGVVRSKGRAWRVHRLVWVALHGPIPDGISVLHECDVRACCNPAHLFLGTTQDNTADMVRKGRSTRGERNASAKLTATDVLEIRREHSHGVPRKELAARYGLGSTQLGNIVTRRKWAHI